MFICRIVLTKALPIDKKLRMRICPFLASKLFFFFFFEKRNYTGTTTSSRYVRMCKDMK